MLAAGIPPYREHSEIVGNGNEKAAMQRLILEIKGDVEGGTSLHESLGKHPLYFDDLFVNLVGSEASMPALSRITAGQGCNVPGEERGLKKKVKKALFYPAAVLVVAVLVTIILLVFVIPQFEPVQRIWR